MIALFLGGLGSYLQFFSQTVPVPAHNPLARLPLTLGAWRGQSSQWIDSAQFFPGADDTVARIYRNPGGREVYLFVGYFERQYQGKSLLNYESRSFHDRAQTIAAGLNGEPQSLNETIQEINGRNYAVVFWYPTFSRDLTGAYETKFRTISDAMLHRRNNGAVVLVAVPISQNASPTTWSDLRDFAGSSAPDIRRELF
jgi:EpsI family protein